MSPLHHIGNFLRELLLLAPLGFARGLFLLLPAALLVWILKLPQAEVSPPDQAKSLGGNLRLWAALAVLVQIVIYALL